MTKAAIRRPPESFTEWFPRYDGITKRQRKYANAFTGGRKIPLIRN